MIRSRVPCGCRSARSRATSAAACCGCGPGWRLTVSHIDPEVLALIALGEEAEGPDARAHLARCPHCAHELRALVSVVTVAQQAGDSGALESPPPALWSRVAGLRRRRPAWRRPAAAAVVGVVAGLIIGAGGAAIIHIGQQQAPVIHVMG